MSSSDDINDKLRELRDSYRQQLPAKLAQIDALWQEFQSIETPDKDRLLTLHRLAHNLPAPAQLSA